MSSMIQELGRVLKGSLDLGRRTAENQGPLF